jgi:hypothetical protein
MVSTSRGPGSLVAVFLALAAIVAGASGCSSSDEDSRQAGRLGVRICVLNSWTEKVSVQYTLKDTSTREGLLAPGEQSCAEGTMNVKDCDVSGEILYPDLSLVSRFSLTNPSFGAPIGGFSLGPDEPTWDSCMFAFGEGWSVGDKRTEENGPLRVSMERLPDDGWKEYVLIIEPLPG